MLANLQHLSNTPILRLYLELQKAGYTVKREDLEQGFETAYVHGCRTEDRLPITITAVGQDALEGRLARAVLERQRSPEFWSGIPPVLAIIQIHDSSLLYVIQPAWATVTAPPQVVTQGHLFQAIECALETLCFLQSNEISFTKSGFAFEIIELSEKEWPHLRSAEESDPYQPTSRYFFRPRCQIAMAPGNAPFKDSDTAALSQEFQKLVEERRMPFMNETKNWVIPFLRGLPGTSTQIALNQFRNKIAKFD